MTPGVGGLLRANGGLAWAIRSEGAMRLRAAVEVGALEELPSCTWPDRALRCAQGEALATVASASEERSIFGAPPTLGARSLASSCFFGTRGARLSGLLVLRQREGARQ